VRVRTAALRGARCGRQPKNWPSSGRPGPCGPAGHRDSGAFHQRLGQGPPRVGYRVRRANARASARLAQAYQEAHPLARGLPTRPSSVQLAFPVEAALPAAPAARAGGAPAASARAAARFGLGAARVRGHLVAEFGAALAWRFGLLLLSTDARGLPLRARRRPPGCDPMGAEAGQAARAERGGRVGSVVWGQMLTAFL